ncbi:MAG TPA: uroporphyrinogen decarboxylase family protein [bacterium]|nr:uroporphyrinogen decarboxylase family protein [bacterium]HQL63984.1 uroporphyrinogen decarboxylase family protein [bacterium]
MSPTISCGSRSLDLDRHNAEVRDLWQAYREGDPSRCPIVFGINPRLYLQDPKLNTEGITFREYVLNPDVMFQVQLKHQYYVRHHIPQDQEMGLPRSKWGYMLGRCDVQQGEEDESSGWTIYVDFQNVYEGAWLGCPVEFPGHNESPYCVPLLTDDKKELLFDRGIPDPFKDGGWIERNIRTQERMMELAKTTVFQGKPVNQEVELSGTGTDGPFTAYCELRGAENACLDMALDPEYFHCMMSFLTEAISTRIRAYRQYMGREIIQPTFTFADDCVELLSVEMYREHVLPYHKRLIEMFTNGRDNSIHLCGNASRLFKIIKDELKVLHFDTGYPIDHGAVRRELGPEVEIFGGPRVEFFLGEVGPLLSETRRILDSGVREGKKFVLREGNNLPPRCPLENLWEFYLKGREWGRYL